MKITICWNDWWDFWRRCLSLWFYLLTLWYFFYDLTFDLKVMFDFWVIFIIQGKINHFLVVTVLFVRDWFYWFVIKCLVIIGVVCDLFLLFIVLFILFILLIDLLNLLSLQFINFVLSSYCQNYFANPEFF